METPNSGVAEKGLTEVNAADNGNVRNNSASSWVDELAAAVPVLKPDIRIGASLVAFIQYPHALPSISNQHITKQNFAYMGRIIYRLCCRFEVNSRDPVQSCRKTGIRKKLRNICTRTAHP